MSTCVPHTAHESLIGFARQEGIGLDVDPRELERRIVLAGGAVTCFGSAARALGLLAVTLGRWDEARAVCQNAAAHNAGQLCATVLYRVA